MGCPKRSTCSTTRSSIQVLRSHYCANCTSLLSRWSHHYLIQKRNNLYVNQPICTWQEEVTTNWSTGFWRLALIENPMNAPTFPFFQFFISSVIQHGRGNQQTWFNCQLLNFGDVAGRDACLLSNIMKLEPGVVERLVLVTVQEKNIHGILLGLSC